jgi:RNA 2',3'-cyclic 3'-phosphodiesterase
MRLFVAVAPPPATLDHLAAALAKARLGGPPGDRLRWIPPERWHLTLVFLGEVDDTRVDRLAAAVGPVATAWPPLALSLRGSGAFPGVLWIGLAGDLADLDRLARAARRAVRAAGIAVERRPYRPHLTVARSRQPAAAELNAARDRLGPYAGPAFTVDALRLVRSYPGPQPRYAEVAAWPLGGPVTPAPPPR